MSKPAISGLPQNIFVSSAALLIDGIDVGLVSGVKVNIKETVAPVKTDQLGSMVVNHFYTGHEISGELTFDEFTAAKMKIPFPQANLVSSGGVSRLTFGQQIGADYYSKAKEFKFIPTNDDTNNNARHFRFWKCVFMGEASIDYGPDKKLHFKAKFHAYPDVSKPSGEWMGEFGDPAAGALVPSSFTPAVPGLSNVGLGLVGSIFTSDTFTKTETWTLTCIHAIANSGIFSVVGSVTGARGNATVGSAYVSNSAVPANSELGFTISDGTPDFVVGDTFTVATTQSNHV